MKFSTFVFAGFLNVVLPALTPAQTITKTHEWPISDSTPIAKVPLEFPKEPFLKARPPAILKSTTLPSKSSSDELEDIRRQVHHTREGFEQLGVVQAAEELAWTQRFSPGTPTADLDNVELLAKATEVLGPTANDRPARPVATSQVRVPRSLTKESQLWTQVESCRRNINGLLDDSDRRSAEIRLESGFLPYAEDDQAIPKLRGRLSPQQKRLLATELQDRQRLLALRQSVGDAALRRMTDIGFAEFKLGWLKQDIAIAAELSQSGPEWRAYRERLEKLRGQLANQLKALRRQEEHSTMRPASLFSRQGRSPIEHRLSSNSR